jgi:hypothetical protein
MLDGDDEAIHSSTIAQQPQVWSIKEHHHPRSQSRLSSRQPFNPGTAVWRINDRPPGGSVADFDLPIVLGPSLNGHLPVGIEVSEQMWQDTGTTSRGPTRSHSPASSPAPTFPSPILVASYVDPSTGLRTQSVYSTWVGEYDAIANAASEVERRQIASRHEASNRASSSRGDTTTVGYADSYGFSGPQTSQPSSRPSNRRDSFDAGLMENILPGRPDSTNDFADTTPQDIILTGKVRGVIWRPGIRC